AAGAALPKDSSAEPRTFPLTGEVKIVPTPSHRRLLESLSVEAATALPSAPALAQSCGGCAGPSSRRRNHSDDGDWNSDTENDDPYDRIDPGGGYDGASENLEAPANEPDLAAQFPGKLRLSGLSLAELRRATLAAATGGLAADSSSSSSSSSSPAPGATSPSAWSDPMLLEQLMVDAVTCDRFLKLKNRKDCHRRLAEERMQQTQQEVLRIVADMSGGVEFSFVGLFTRPYLGVPAYVGRYQAVPGASDSRVRGPARVRRLLDACLYELEVVLLRPPGQQDSILFQLAVQPWGIIRDGSGKRLPQAVSDQVRHYFQGDAEIIPIRSYRPGHILRGEASSFDMLFRKPGSIPQFQLRSPKPHPARVRLDFVKTCASHQTAGQIYRNLALNGAGASNSPESIQISGMCGDCRRISGVFRRCIVRAPTADEPNRERRSSEAPHLGETVNWFGEQVRPSHRAAGTPDSASVALPASQEEHRTPLRFSHVRHSPSGLAGETESESEYGGSCWESESCYSSAGSSEEEEDDPGAGWVFYYCAETDVMLCPLVFRRNCEDDGHDDSEDEMLDKPCPHSSARWIFIQGLGCDVANLSEVAVQQSLTEAFAWMDVPGERDLAGETDVAVLSWAALPSVSLAPAFSPEDEMPRQVTVPKEPIIYKGPSTWKDGERPFEVSCQVLQSSLGLQPTGVKGSRKSKRKAKIGGKGNMVWYMKLANAEARASKLAKKEGHKRSKGFASDLLRNILPASTWISLDALDLTTPGLAKCLQLELRGAFQRSATAVGKQHLLAMPSPDHRKALAEVPPGLDDWIEFGQRDILATAEFLSALTQAHVSSDDSDDLLDTLPPLMTGDANGKDKFNPHRAAKPLYLQVQLVQGPGSAPDTLDVRICVQPGLFLVALLSPDRMRPPMDPSLVQMRFEWRLETRRQPQIGAAEQAAQAASGTDPAASATALEAPLPAEETDSVPAASSSPSAGQAFSLQNNLEDRQHEQPAGFQAFPLRPEQLRTLHWMREAERAEVPFIYDHEVVDDMPSFNPGWRLRGRLRRAVKMRGGILADKVGYGKTATTIGLIASTLQDPLPELKGTSAAGPRIPSRATLVLCPPNLQAQWVREVHKFLGSDGLKVVPLQTYTQLKRITARELAEADIVICNYRIFYSSPYLARLRELSLEFRASAGQATPAGVKQRGRNAKRQSRGSGKGRVDRNGYQRSRRKGAQEELPLGWPPRSPQPVYERPVKMFERQYARVLAQFDAAIEIKSVSGTALGSNPGSETLPLPCIKRRRLSKGPPVEPSGDQQLCSLERLLSGEEVCAGSSSQQQRRKTPKEKLKRCRRSSGSSKSSASGVSGCAGPPLLELFNWKRIVLDEFHELLSGHPPAQVAVRYLRSHYRWGLSGTLPCKTVNDVTKASSFFQVFLRASRSSPPAPYAVCQRWLDHCVRRNTAGLPELQSEEAIVPVRQHPAERALYLQLTQARLPKIAMNNIAV
ncbi:unnamed protein product, partial [Polarella glacialis]